MTHLKPAILSLFLAGAAGPALTATGHATSIHDLIVALRADGYTVTSMTRTFLGRIRIEATDGRYLREIVVSRSTGEIKQDAIFEIEDDDIESGQTASAGSRGAGAPDPGSEGDDDGSGGGDRNSGGQDDDEQGDDDQGGGGSGGGSGGGGQGGGGGGGGPGGGGGSKSSSNAK